MLQEFSVPAGSSAFFNNAPEIQNIISRVTGGLKSDIQGSIAANGTANLFLINPNGIVFGPNAALKIGGSFVASTANSLKFADGTEYSATNPQTTPLLTVSVPIGLQFPGMPASILNQSRPVGLAVQPGQTIALVGGDVLLEGGQITAPGGRIALGSVAGNSLVSLTPTDRGLVLGYEGVQNFGDILLSGAGLNTSSFVGGGDIELVGRRISLSNGSFASSSTFGPLPAGNITIRASESLEMTGNASIGDLLEKILQGRLLASDISNGLFALSFGAGASGNISIETRQLTAQNRAVAATTTFGDGLGGYISVNATDSVQLIDAGLLTGTAGSQKAGDLTINTGQLILRNGAVAGTSTVAAGDGGLVSVRANSVELSGTTSGEYNLFGRGPTAPISSGLFTLSAIAGRAGDLIIETNTLIVENQASVSTSTNGAGRAGDITVTASESVKLTGTGKLDILEKIFVVGIPTLSPSDLRSSLVTSGFPEVTEEGKTEPTTGAAGNITITTGKLFVENGAVISSSTFNEGTGGDLTVSANPGLVEVNGGGLLTGTAGSQPSGNLTINAGTLRMLNGGIAATSTVKTGQGGDLNVNARTVELTGLSNSAYNLPLIFGEKSPTQQIPSGLLTLSFGTGNAGNLEIVSDRFNLENGAAVSTSTFRDPKEGEGGDGGNLTLKASESVTLTGKGTFEQRLAEIFARQFDASKLRSGLFTSSFSTGKAGDLTIETGKFAASNGALVSASTFLGGLGGNLTVKTPPTGSVELTDAGLLTGTAEMAGAAGDLKIATGQLSLLNGAEVATATLGSNAGGKLTVEADTVDLQGTSKDGFLPSGLFTLSFSAASAGDLEINARVVTVRNGANVAASTFSSGNGGSITVRASESVELSGNQGSQFSTGLRSDAREDLNPFDLNAIVNARQGTPGNLTIQTGNLLLRDGSEIAVSAGQTGNGGNIKINADTLVAFPRENSDITANASTGNGGQVEIEAQGIFGTNFRDQPTANSDITASSKQGSAGIVQLNRPDVDASLGLADLQAQPIDPTQQISPVCSAGGAAVTGEFIITGRGGLPPRPSDPPSSDAVRVGLVEPAPPSSDRSSASQEVRRNRRETVSLPPPARGVAVNEKGELVLTASAANGTAYSPGLSPVDCHRR